MSAFTVDEVRHLAALARVELSAEEAAAFAQQLGDILAFATEVQAVDLTALMRATTVPGTTLPPASPSREDALEPSLDRTAVLGAAAGADCGTGVFKVPRVING